MASSVLTSHRPGRRLRHVVHHRPHGEAIDNPVKGNATPQQTRRAALLGGVAGATDMVDNLLPMLGSTGRVLGFVKRMGVAAVKGALMEAGQEASSS